MNRKQRIVLAVVALALALTAAFSPHRMEGYVAAASDLVRYGESGMQHVSGEWNFRFIGAESVQNASVEVEDDVVSTTLLYERMTGEWLALMGFIMIVGMGALILFKEEPRGAA